MQCWGSPDLLWTHESITKNVDTVVMNVLHKTNKGESLLSVFKLRQSNHIIVDGQTFHLTNPHKSDDPSSYIFSHILFCALNMFWKIFLLWSMPNWITKISVEVF